MEKDVILILAGLVVGAMNSMAGGGMLLGFPIFLAVGLPPLVANATSNIGIMPGSLSSAFGYRKYLRRLPKRYLVLLVPCIIGAAVGATILSNTTDDRFQDLVPGLVLFAVLLFAFQPFLHKYMNTHIRKRPKAIKPLAVISLALLPVATYGGYFGAGFGFILLAFLGFTKLNEIHMMNGLKNLASVSVATTSIIVLFSTGLLNWRAGLCMAVGTTIGGYSGAIYSQKISNHALRIIIIVIGLFTAAYLGLRTY